MCQAQGLEASINFLFLIPPVFRPSPFLSLSPLPPQGSSQAPGTSRRSTEAVAALLGGGGQVYTSISSSNLSYSEHHTGNDASWPVNLHADGLRAAVPSSCYWPRPGDAGQVSQRRSRQHPALRSNPARAGKASRLSQAPTSGSIERFYLILAEPVTR